MTEAAPEDIMAAALKLRERPEGITALQHPRFDGLYTLAQEAYREIVGPERYTASGAYHAMEMAIELGIPPKEKPPKPPKPPKGPRGQQKRPRAVPPDMAADLKAEVKHWEPEVCRSAGLCYEVIQSDGRKCLTCGAMRRPPRPGRNRKLTRFEGENTRRAREDREARIAFEVDGVAYNYAGERIGKVAKGAVPRKPGQPYPRFKRGDEIGTLVIQYDDQNQNLIQRLADCLGMTDDALGEVIGKGRVQTRMMRIGQSIVALGTPARDALRKVLMFRIDMAAALIKDLDELEAYNEKLMRGEG